MQTNLSLAAAADDDDDDDDDDSVIVSLGTVGLQMSSVFYRNPKQRFKKDTKFRQENRPRLQ